MKNFAIRDVLDLIGKDTVTRKPLVIFESLKASMINVKSNTVYARGGKGDPKLVGFSGSKDVKLDAEEATLSPESLGLLMGSIPSKYKKVVHFKEDLEVPPDATDPTKAGAISLKFNPKVDVKYPMFVFTSEPSGKNIKKELTKATATGTPTASEYDLTVGTGTTPSTIKFGTDIKPYDVIIVDYYYETLSETNEIKISTDKFPSSLFWEGWALVRTEGDGKDHMARITIPNGKLLTDDITLDFKATGDPSTFKFSIECLKPLRGKDMLILDIDEDSYSTGY